MKVKRHQKILELIGSHDVETQEELLTLLNACGYQVTQATVSRDIKELRLIKTLSGDGYKYTQSGARPPERGRLDTILSEAVRDIDFAGNIVVIKCHTGMANAACQALDDMELAYVVGTIAGDNTIFALTKNEQAAKQLITAIQTICGSLQGGI